MPEESREVRVAIAGAGIAGLTAALRLAQRGYKVTVYEANPFLGGNLSAHEHHGVYHEVYCHMFSNWYNNFWDIVETDLKLPREYHFEPRTGFKFLHKGRFPHFMQMTNVGSLQSAFANLQSGLAPIPDVFLWSYSMIDLLAQSFHQDELLSQTSVNGFMASRPYATNRSAALHDAFLQTVWAVHSYRTSAAAYKRFIKYTFPHPDPELWVLKGNVYDEIMKPLQSTLEELGCKIETNVSVRRVILDQGKVDRIQLQDTEFLAQHHRTRPLAGTLREQPVDYLILAVPPITLGRLITTGEAHHRIADILPALAEVRRLRAEPIPVLDIYFKKKLADIPKEYVALLDSRYDLTFLDTSQSWSDLYKSGVTVLNVSASDFYALPSSEHHYEDAYDILKELHSYIPRFNPGTHWGDPHSDIDWDKSDYQPNAGEELYLNTVGSEQWRPETTYPKIPNLFFAGNFCKTTVDIATVETAVVSGLQAAQALWQQERLGDPIKIIAPDAYPESVIMAMKLLLAPYAYGAKWWSMSHDVVPLLAQGRLPKALGSNMIDMLWAPYTLAADWWQTMWSMYKSMFPDGDNR